MQPAHGHAQPRAHLQGTRPAAQPLSPSRRPGRVSTSHGSDTGCGGQRGEPERAASHRLKSSPPADTETRDREAAPHPGPPSRQWLHEPAPSPAGSRQDRAGTLEPTYPCPSVHCVTPGKLLPLSCERGSLIPPRSLSTSILTVPSTPYPCRSSSPLAFH